MTARPLAVTREPMERVMGIEPTLVAWEATVLPLNYTRRSIEFYSACTTNINNPATQAREIAKPAGRPDSLISVFEPGPISLERPAAPDR